MNPANAGRRGYRWQKIRTYILQRDTHCARCGRPLHPELRNPHPYSSTVDHVIALVEGGDPYDPANLVAMHRTCNIRKENQRRVSRTMNTSRDW